MSLAEQYLIQEYGAYRDHYEWKAIEKAFNAGFVNGESSVLSSYKFLLSSSNKDFEEISVELEELNRKYNIQSIILEDMITEFLYNQDILKTEKSSTVLG